ncbi:unnamed protein product, partial [Citrullus colocynthis]
MWEEGSVNLLESLKLKLGCNLKKLEKKASSNESKEVASTTNHCDAILNFLERRTKKKKRSWWIDSAVFGM